MTTYSSPAIAEPTAEPGPEPAPEPDKSEKFDHHIHENTDEKHYHVEE